MVKLRPRDTIAAPPASGLFSDFINNTNGIPPKKNGTTANILHSAPPGSMHRVTIEQSVGGVDKEWTPVPFKGDEVDTSTCFGCTYGMCQPNEEQPTLKGLWQLFRDNYGVMVNREIAKLMHEYFKAEIQKPMQEAGHDVSWSVDEIVRHIEVHMLEPTVNASTAIQNFRKIARWLRNEVRVKNRRGTKKVNLKVLRSLIEVENLIQRLYAGKNTKQLFYSDYFKLDDRRAYHS